MRKRLYCAFNFTLCYRLLKLIFYYGYKMEGHSEFFQAPLQQMNLSDFKLFQKLIYAKTGINMTDKKITLLSNRLRKRLKALTRRIIRTGS